MLFQDPKTNISIWNTFKDLFEQQKHFGLKNRNSWGFFSQNKKSAKKCLGWNFIVQLFGYFCRTTFCVEIWRFLERVFFFKNLPKKISLSSKTIFSSLRNFFSSKQKRRLWAALIFQLIKKFFITWTTKDRFNEDKFLVTCIFTSGI